MVKKKRRGWRILRNSLLTVVGIIVLWILFHQIMTAYEKQKHPAMGALVEVDGKEMHVFTKGEGEHTILLMSGLGTAAPVLDFEPLMNELAKEHKVVIVEPFGYGWSDQTERERTVENVVEELRSALQATGTNGPYIVMAHSISGIYSMYYANKYPEEVKAVVGIDFTLPQALNYFGENAPSTPSYSSLIAPTGIFRAVSIIFPNDILPIAEKGTYSDVNLNMTKAISSWKLNNKNVIDEINEIANNVEKTKELSFPNDLPIMIFYKDAEKVHPDGKTLKTFYESQLSNHPSNRIIQLEGHHYLHWNQYERMTNDVNEFITNL